MRIIDLHTHGIDGFDTGSSDPDAILKMAEIHGRAGVSEIMPSIYPAPIDVMRANMAAVKAAMERQSPARHDETESPQLKAQHSGLRAASILGVHLEGPFLNPARCGALDPACFFKPEERTFRELMEGFEEIVRIVTIAPEQAGALKLIRTMSGQGIKVNMGHSDATYAESEAGFHAGARGITHLFNAMRGFHQREPGISGFGLLNLEIWVELIGDLRHLDPKTIELVFRIKDPGRIILISDSVKETKSCVYRDSGQETGRLVGGSTPLPAAVQELVKRGFDAELTMRAATENPRDYLSS